ncbi:hypothetical protein BJV78DRAFT_1278074 [Lactifluus subvellereus]|nr:hypothetical protein BJV78DRAFT_1278074 [Lactifluus subvellereus]
MANQPLFTRELLQRMKRADLQRVCKERGLKANLKTEEMIELLLDLPHSQSPRRLSRHRTVSTRSAGRRSATRSRLHSTSSMIIHSDTDEDDEQQTVKPETGAPSSHHHGPMTRTRKARDAQLRLGVGRPTAAGGQGARTVTRSVSVAKGTRPRSGRGAKPAQAPIVEVPILFTLDETSREQDLTDTTDDTLLPPSNQSTSQSRVNESGHIRRTSAMDTSTDEAGVRAVVEEQVRTLQRTVALLQGQLQQQASTHAREVAALNDRVVTVMDQLRELHRHAEAIQLLRSSMEELQTELSRVRQGRGPEPVHEPTNMSASASIPPDGSSHPTNVRAHRQIEPTRQPRPSRSSPAFEYPPPPAGSPMKPPSREVPMESTLLGKRQRSADTTVSEIDQEDTADKDSRTGILYPSRKRTKMEQSTDSASETPLAGPSNTAANGQAENGTSMDRPPEVTIPRQSDATSTAVAPRQPSKDRVVGGEIFTDQDFDFFDNPPSQLRPSQAAENQHPFTFAFADAAQPSTPAVAGVLSDPSSSPVLSNLPYPERPHSPSPAPIPHRVVVARRPQGEAYRPFGFPPESGNLPGSSATDGSAIDPASILRTPPRPSPDLPSPDSDPIDIRRRASSNDVGVGLGMTSVPVRVDDTPVSSMRRTMYGTELEGDTRFGDFGVEGVATGFWAGGRF